MNPADKDSITRVEDRLFGHRRYGSAIHGPKAANSTTEEFRAAPYHGKPA